jgi:hypothetical protein
MNDTITQIEVVLNFLNTLFAKAINFKKVHIVNELSALRREIYYGDNFDYELTLKKLQDIVGRLEFKE